MSKKHIVLFLLFFLNYLAAVATDYSHFASVSLDDTTLSSISSHDHDNSNASDHCEKDDCHNGHIHYFLTSNWAFAVSLPEFSIHYQVSDIFIISPVLGIAKPPHVKA